MVSAAGAALPPAPESSLQLRVRPAHSCRERPSSAQGSRVRGYGGRGLSSLPAAARPPPDRPGAALRARLQTATVRRARGTGAARGGAGRGWGWTGCPCT